MNINKGIIRQFIEDTISYRKPHSVNDAKLTKDHSFGNLLPRAPSTCFATYQKHPSLC